MSCVEIGSFEGRGSLKIIEHLCQHSESKLYCIDPWEDSFKGTAGITRTKPQLYHNQYLRFIENTKESFKIIPLRGISDTQIPELPVGLDFAYVDCLHTPEQVYKDAIGLFPKLKVGAIMLFDDYGWKYNGIATKIGIDRFIEEMGDKCVVLFKNYQAAVQKMKE
jgi:hypothetical protein